MKGGRLTAGWAVRRPHTLLMVAAFTAALLPYPLKAGPASTPAPAITPAPAQPSPSGASTEAGEPPSAEAAPPAPRAEESDRLPFMLEDKREAEAPSAAGLIARTLGALLVVVGLIAAGAWGLKKFGGARFGSPPADAPTLKVVSSVPLGDKRSLAVVRFGQRVLLVGCAPQAMTLLAEQPLNERPPADFDQEQASAGAAAGPPFRSVADLLSGEDAPPFADELSEAEQRLAAALTNAAADGRPQ
jgi:flagellar protein FliO/FliZ